MSMQDSFLADELKSTMVQNLGYESIRPVHPKIHDINVLLEWIKGFFLHIKKCRIFMTLGNDRIYKSSPTEDSVLTVLQKTEASNQTIDSLQQTLACDDL